MLNRRLVATAWRFKMLMEEEATVGREGRCEYANTGDRAV
jgi:hypothetical protein